MGLEVIRTGTFNTRPLATPAELTADIIAVSALVLLWCGTLAQYAVLPTLIPTHFNFLGTIDKLDHKNILLILPMLAAILFPVLGLLAGLARELRFPWAPQAASAARQQQLARQAIRVARAQLVTSQLAVQVLMLLTAHGLLGGIGLSITPLLVGGLLITLCGYFWVARRLG